MFLETCQQGQILYTLSLASQQCYVTAGVMGLNIVLKHSAGNASCQVRATDCVCCQAAIRKELNEFKSAEMEVHEESKKYTRYTRFIVHWGRGWV